MLASQPHAHAATPDATTQTYDVVIYGGTSAAVTAAVQVKQMGKSVIIVCPDKHLGGLTSGGLGWTDTGNKAVIGGLARDFYHRIYLEYQKPERWPFQSSSEYGNKGQGTEAIDGDNRTMWIFEPRVAEKVFDDYVAEYDIPVHRQRWLDREHGVTKSAGRIQSIQMLSGERYAGKIFMDTTYEGDLMAAADISFHVGRESRDTYGEEYNGVQTGVLHHGHHFGGLPPISPYRVPGDPGSGVLPRISPDPPGEKYSGDHRVQAYCFRMCLTDHDPNRVPFAKPDGYDPDQYELMARIYQAGWRDTFNKFDPIPNHKTDTNNHGPMSTDNIGFNYDYPNASYERRQEIIDEHRRYQQGWLYFICTDPRVPEATRKKMQQWGLAKDEFVDNGHWPHQLYIREARRMIGSYVMTENELLKRQPTPQSVGMGSYTMDSHNVQRYITPEGDVQNEGDIGVSTKGPYQIAYGSLVPKADECTNLFVPVCLSSSHIAFGSIRMEPVFMILGQSAATAAVMAIDDNVSVQQVDYDRLKQRIEADGQVLTYSGSIDPQKSVSVKSLPGIVVDDDQATLTGQWKQSQANGPYVQYGYQHHVNAKDYEPTATFSPTLQTGTYEVRMAFPRNTNRATNVPVTVRHRGGQTEVKVNQRVTPPIDDQWVSLGKFEFDANQPAAVVVGSHGTDGYVIIDAVQFLKVETK
ncbi:FAD-dependent oxidoreductase [Stieleria varia]